MPTNQYCAHYHRHHHQLTINAMMIIIINLISQDVIITVIKQRLQTSTAPITIVIIIN